MLMENLEQKYEAVGLDEGPAPESRSMPQIEPARIAAEKLQ